MHEQRGFSDFFVCAPPCWRMHAGWVDKHGVTVLAVLQASLLSIGQWHICLQL